MATAKLMSFRVFKTNQLVREEKLNQGVIKIGKVASAHLRLDDELVSRMHAIIEVIGADASVIDLGSTGGTFVNGQKVNKAKLQAGDKITVGESTIEFVGFGEQAEPSVVVSPALAVTTPAPVRVAPPALPVRTQTMPVTTAPAPIAVAATSLLPAPQPKPAFAVAQPMPLDEGGAKAVEVAAMLGDSVVDVKHCTDPRGGKVTRLTWGFAATGLACLIASATAFGVSVSNAATNKAAFEHHTRVLHKPAHAFRPAQLSPVVDGVAFAGLSFGLSALITAMLRSRRERKSPFYRIGTAPDVQQAVDNAPSPSFPLVAPSGDDFVFNYAPGIDGELTTADGKITSLAELAATGRPSTSAAGAIEVPIPMAARIRARAGQTTFVVSGTSKPAENAKAGFAINSRTAAYTAGSLVAHLGILALLYSMPYEGSNVNVDLANLEDTSVKTSGITKLDTPPELDPEKTGDNDSGAENTASPMKLDSGAAGKPDAVRTDGHMAIQNRNVEPRLAREAAIEAARTAGVLGSVEAIKGGIASLTATDPFSSGFDMKDIYGPLIGSEGEGRGNFGFGRHGFGPGGGCYQEPCGIIGVKGPYATIGTGAKAGEGWRGGGSWGNGGRRTGMIPNSTEIGTPSPVGNLDKAIIKRYIKRNIEKISYCYESQLLARPGIQGQMTVQFLIAGNGAVQSSQGAGFDGAVASCVANVIKNIQFPAPSDGGSVQVNYPFTFHAAGSQ